MTEPIALPPELDWLELENIKWKLQLIQARHNAGITREDMIAACGSPQIIAEVEDLLNGDPTLGTLRRYAAAIGAVHRIAVFDAPTEEEKL